LYVSAGRFENLPADFRSDETIEASDKYEMIADGAVRTLVIKRPAGADEAVYACKAANVKTSTRLRVEGT